MLLPVPEDFPSSSIREFVNAAEMFADATMTETYKLSADKTIEEITVVTNHDEAFRRNRARPSFQCTSLVFRSEWWWKVGSLEQ